MVRRRGVKVLEYQVKDRLRSVIFCSCINTSSLFFAQAFSGLLAKSIFFLLPLVLLHHRDWFGVSCCSDMSVISSWQQKIQLNKSSYTDFVFILSAHTKTIQMDEQQLS